MKYGKKKKKSNSINVKYAVFSHQPFLRLVYLHTKEHLRLVCLTNPRLWQPVKFKLLCIKTAPTQCGPVNTLLNNCQHLKLRLIDTPVPLARVALGVVGTVS